MIFPVTKGGEIKYYVNTETKERISIYTYGQSQIPKKPRPIKRVTRYTTAVATWIAKGLPERTQEEVDKILSTFCLKCDWYKDGICNGCGCNVNASKIAILNKIKMKTQHCPKGLW